MPSPHLTVRTKRTMTTPFLVASLCAFLHTGASSKNPAWCSTMLQMSSSQVHNQSISSSGVHAKDSSRTDMNATHDKMQASKTHRISTKSTDDGRKTAKSQKDGIITSHQNGTSETHMGHTSRPGKKTDSDVVAVQENTSQVPGFFDRYGPVYPPTDFETDPPIPLVANATNASSPLQLSKSITFADKPQGTRARKTILSLTGRDLTFTDPKGNYTYATIGDIWTMHYHTYLVNVQTGTHLAWIYKTFFAFHAIYEIASYDQACPSQEPSDFDDAKRPVYPAVRITKYMFSFYPYFSVERYNCDGSLSLEYMIRPRYWFSLKDYFDVVQARSDDKMTVATIDQTYLFSFTPYYDTWAATGTDPVLVACMTLTVDLDRMLTRAMEEELLDSASKSDQGGGGGDKGDSGAGR